MVSQSMLVQALDMLTSPAMLSASFGLEALGPGAPGRINHARNIVDQKNVVAIGISDKISDNGQNTGILAMTFYVDKKKPMSKLKGDEAIPPALVLGTDQQPVPTDVVAIGKPKLEATVPWAKRKPIKPGFSIGHPGTTAGTLGAIVKKNGKFYLLSNSHVLAKSGTAKLGDRILYPGKADGGGLSKDVVGHLEEFLAFTLGGSMVNRADCALAVPLPEKMTDVVAEIEKLGLPQGTLKAKRGMKVTKAGRTTGLTTAEIKDVNFRMTIEYPHGLGDLWFLDQVFCTRYTDGGDSGALVLEKTTKKAVGLHFAGYPDADDVLGSVFNPIQEVLKALKVRLVTKPIPK